MFDPLGPAIYNEEGTTFFHRFTFDSGSHPYLLSNQASTDFFRVDDNGQEQDQRGVFSNTQDFLYVVKATNPPTAASYANGFFSKADAMNYTPGGTWAHIQRDKTNMLTGEVSQLV